MYLPQAASGVASPPGPPTARSSRLDRGRALSRRARLGHRAPAHERPGYDYQPDWSPDGRLLAYASYHDDAVELRALELASGAAGRCSRTARSTSSRAGRPTAGGWPSRRRRTRGASTCSCSTRRTGKAGSARRLTEERDSGLPRYYYSRFDQYLSPSWSPDGSELVLVSNRGRISGSGGLWRMKAEPGRRCGLVRDEETTWKARPDWARDGRRVVYASYTGRQWHQLWLASADGGDAFPLTYGDFDATAPRWSPDGTRIAYVSNEDGAPSLWTIGVPGGERRRVEIRERRRMGAWGRLRIDVTENGRYVPARVSVTTPDGRSFVRRERGGTPTTTSTAPSARSSTATSTREAAATCSSPPGPVTVEVSRGLEYRPVRQTLDVPEAAARAGRGARAPRRLARARVVERRPARAHELRRRLPRDARDAASMAEAEDLHVVFDLIVNKEERIPDIAWFTGRPDPVSTERTLLRHDQEFHTSWWGHLSFLGLTSHVLLPDYAGYAGTAAASLSPSNADVAGLARAQGALVGYVHPFDHEPDLSRAAIPPPTRSRASSRAIRSGCRSTSRSARSTSTRPSD
jgi:Tol biopolymer transport system component